jgi:hypothetical protein
MLTSHRPKILEPTTTKHQHNGSNGLDVMGSNVEAEIALRQRCRYVWTKSWKQVAFCKMILVATWNCTTSHDRNQNKTTSHDRNQNTAMHRVELLQRKRPTYECVASWWSRGRSRSQTGAALLQCPKWWVLLFFHITGAFCCQLSLTAQLINRYSIDNVSGLVQRGSHCNVCWVSPRCLVAAAGGQLDESFGSHW